MVFIQYLNPAEESVTRLLQHVSRLPVNQLSCCLERSRLYFVAKVAGPFFFFYSVLPALVSMRAQRQSMLVLPPPGPLLSSLLIMPWNVGTDAKH